MSKVSDDGISLPSLTVDVGLSDRLRIHNTGTSAYTNTKASMIIHPAVRRAPADSALIAVAAGADAPKSLMNTTAIRMTQPKINTEIADQGRH